jgi:hypothetical protein
MRLWVGVTDPDWFSFLSRADIDEVNFWQPSATAPLRRAGARSPPLVQT